MLTFGRVESNVIINGHREPLTDLTELLDYCSQARLALTLHNIITTEPLRLVNPKLESLVIANVRTPSLDLSGLPNLKSLQVTGQVAEITGHEGLTFLIVASHTPVRLGSYPELTYNELALPEPIDWHNSCPIQRGKLSDFRLDEPVE